MFFLEIHVWDFTRPRVTTRSMFLLITVFSLAAGFWAYPAPAAIYKWVDETGKVHYSDKPPVTQETEELDIESNPTSDTPSLSDEQRRKKQKRVLDAFTKERQEKEAEQAKLEEEQKERRIWCARAKDDLRELKEASYLYDYDDSGEKVVYLKEAREKATREYEAEMKRRC